MKKIFVVLLELSVLNCFFCFAQVSADKAARKTAEKCLKLSESYLLHGDVDAALSQAEMGLAYDDSVSDLYYMKAVTMKMNGATVSEVLDLAKTANEKNSWIGYNEKGNRILYADLLSDTGKYEESLEILDRAPFVFSADAEAIRIKNYYRIGSNDYLSKARSKVNTARRIYKGDLRFFNLFFGFEISRCIKGGLDYVPEMQALEVADLLNAELKSYNDVNDELTCLSIFFMEGEEQIRALKAFAANGGSDILYPVIALKSGYLDQSTAIDSFFEIADKNVAVELLRYFATMITEDDAIQMFCEHLNAYSGTLLADVDDDMQCELEVAYERGRPSIIHFDLDSDGVEDLYGTLDFGEILSIKVKNFDMEIQYSPYPWIGQAVVTKDGETLCYEFSKNAMQLSFISFETPTELDFESNENKFYVPFVKTSWDDKLIADFLNCTTFVQGNSFERENATVTYSMLDGNVVSAVYTINGVLYAAADFEANLPAVRTIDYDNDGILEATEFYSPLPKENIEKFSEFDKDFIKRLFAPFDYSEKVFLSGVLIDYDNDNFPEFQEFYTENDGKNTTWFFPEGKTQIHIRYPHEKNESVIEDSIFTTGIDNRKVTVETIDGIPFQVKMDEEVYELFSGMADDFYWFGKDFESARESEIIDRLNEVDQGTVLLIQTDNDTFLCVKVGSLIFARKGYTLGPLTSEEENEDTLESEPAPVKVTDNAEEKKQVENLESSSSSSVNNNTESNDDSDVVDITDEIEMIGVIKLDTESEDSN